MPPQVSNGTAKVTIKADDFKRGNSLYTIVDGPSWTEAEREANRLGGHLVTINDGVENSFLSQRFQDNSKGTHNNKWIGLSDYSNEGNFIWSNNSESTYRNWAVNEPNVEQVKIMFILCS